MRHQAALGGLAQQRLAQRREVLGEDRDDVDRGSPAQSSSRPSGGSTTTKPPATSTVGTIAETNGTSASPPSGTADDEQVLGLVPDGGHLAQHRAVGQPRGQADQLVVVEGVGVLDLGEVGDRRPGARCCAASSAASRLVDLAVEPGAAACRCASARRRR